MRYWSLCSNQGFANTRVNACLFDDDVTVVQIRNMLASPDFPHAIQRVQEQGQLEAVMGPYLPMTMYLQPNQVETFFPCYPGSS